MISIYYSSLHNKWEAQSPSINPPLLGKVILEDTLVNLFEAMRDDPAFQVASMVRYFRIGPKPTAVFPYNDEDILKFIASMES